MNLMFLKIMIHHNQQIVLGQMTLGSIYQCAYGILPTSTQFLQLKHD